MSRVFTSPKTGAGIYVFSDDHCPPHVHGRHRGEGWIARVEFSYLSDALELLSIAPTKNIPLQRVVNDLLNDIQTELPNCRQSWWTMQRTTCLMNQWAVVSTGALEVLDKRRADAKQIASADYDSTNERLTVTFKDGTKTEVAIHHGANH